MSLSGELVATASSDGIDFLGALDYARETGGPALRELTFHQRAMLLRALAKRLGESKTEFYELSFRTGATKSDAAIDIEGGIGTVFSFAGFGSRELPKHRATIERVIQDVIFNGVVVRHRDWIKVGNLGEVVGFSTTECAAIESLHKKCCGVVDGHDASSGKNASVPTALDLGKDIAALVATVDAVRAARDLRKKAKSP